MFDLAKSFYGPKNIDGNSSAEYWIGVDRGWDERANGTYFKFPWGRVWLTI